MADLNQATIQPERGGVVGAPVAVTATASPGTLIYSVPTDPEAWYEVTLICSNTDTNDMALILEWGGNAAANRTAEFVSKLSTKTAEPRICRGINIYGYCVTAAGLPGTNTAFKVHVKCLSYKQDGTR